MEVCLQDHSTYHCEKNVICICSATHMLNNTQFLFQSVDLMRFYTLGIIINKGNAKLVQIYDILVRTNSNYTQREDMTLLID